METVRFIEQLCRQPKNALRFTGDRIQLSREWKIDDGTTIILSRPTMEPRHMRFTILAAALLLAACQTQGNDGATVTINGQTIDAAEAKNRATFKRVFANTYACEERANEINRRLTRQAVYRGCLCAIPYYADNAPAEVIARQVAEALGTARPLPDDEIMSLASKARDATRAAYEACGMRYD